MAVTPRSGLRVLLVEDDQLVREIITVMVEDDYEIFHVDSVAGALTELVLTETPRVDIVLLDCLLSHGNIANVLAAACMRSIPVVLISGDADQAKAVDPALPFVRKPFSREKLLWVLDSARR
jgi:DNA-binding NtrC family response regulator